MLYTILKPLLFLQSPEQAHQTAMQWLDNAASSSIGAGIIKRFYSSNSQPVQVAGIEFPNPIGLAAGFDKNAAHIDSLSLLGFGFIEIGTVTPLPQDGNPKPRLFRLPADEALINRMGFNNDGLEVVKTNLRKRKSNTIIGGNIGKNKNTPNEEAVNDYLKGFEALREDVDYFVVNVSSPNTPNLRALQEKKPLTEILLQLQKSNTISQKPKPIFLKIAPDLNQHELHDIVQIVSDTDIAGIVATNTTIERNLHHTSPQVVMEIGNGGLSGKPLTKKSTEVIRFLHKESQGKFPIIGVGGIFTADDAQAKLDAGASLVQVYTGFIYQGPGIAKSILKKLQY